MSPAAATQPPPGRARIRRPLAALTMAYAVVVLALCLVPMRSLPPAPSGSPLPLDKYVHFLLFAPLGVLTLASIAPSGRRARDAALALAACAAFGALIEVLQEAMGLGRAGDPVDALADAVGAAMGIAAYLIAALLLARLRGARP